jgi:peroxiredoxin
MTITIGNSIPNISMKRFGANGLEDFSIADYLKGKKVVLFAVPGAYTPTCNLKHLPGYVANATSIKAKGIDEIICLSVNDPFVMKAWGESAGAEGKVTMLSDWKAELVTALGLTLDAAGAGLGTRAQRFMMVVDNCVVKELQVEPVASAVELSGADVCLTKLAA